MPHARREPRTQKLHAERGHPVSNGSVASRKRQPVVVLGAIDHVEVPRGQYAVCAGVGASNERRQVRDYAVRRAVRVDPPRSVRGRVWTCPASIHGHRDERWSILRDDPGGGNCADAADRDLAFGRRTLGAERSHPASVAQAAFYTLGTFGELRDAVIATMDTGSRQWDYEVVPAERVGQALERASEWLGQLGTHLVLNGPDPDVLPDRDYSAAD